jgi:hypothetical protein
MAVTCKKCGGAHPQWECNASPARLAAYAKAQTPTEVEPIVVAKSAPDGKVVKTKAVQEKKRGRPATGFDKTAYQRELMRERRARLKGAKP